MAKDTVERILQAEAAAVTVTEQAKAKAEKLVMNAQGKSELIMNDAKRALKTYEDEKQAEIAQYSLSAMEKAEELCAAQKAQKGFFVIRFGVFRVSRCAHRRLPLVSSDA